MNPGTIFLKTDKGKAEVTSRTANLNPVQRRLLIVIDGKKTITELATMARIGELPAALESLHLLGLIEAPGLPMPMQEPLAPGFAPAAPKEAPRAATSPEHFVVVRQDASDYLMARLGPSGQSICEAIDCCDNPEDLRKMLRGIEILIGQRLDSATTNEFVRYFGKLLL